ncbi:MAG TPA: cytochrome c [Candidatus Dormibacteraeota bacterium]|nr:cytochrome c [Candidatus Dormibacteraeota bacterium]
MKIRPIPIVATVVAIAGAFAFAPHLRSAEPSHAVTLDQGWDHATRVEFYHKSQGAVLMPSAFLRALRMPDGKPFLDPARMHSYGFLPGEPAGNPYPLGIADDDGSKTDGVPMAGFTCAACHTGELTYRGTSVRIDGGSANLNLPAFQSAVRQALMRTATTPELRKPFLRRAIALGYPAAKAAAGLDAEVARDRFVLKAVAGLRGTQTPAGPGIVDALTGIAFNAMTLGLYQSDNARRALAPTNYPPLWDIWHFDWVQYNASVHQPMDRNVGEDIGLGARLNIVDPVTGKLNPESTRWKSTIRIRNLYWLENAIIKLKPPTWPAAFGPVNEAQAAQGRALFVQNCARCHGVSKIAGTTPQEWYMHVLPLKVIGTDPNQAIGFAKTTYNATKLGMSATLGGPEGLAYVVRHEKVQAYEDAHVPKSEWPKYDGFGRSSPVVAPCGYKARPLVGIWATPPFLHNGSVPSVFALLSDTRPAHPILGNPEFDPVNLGYVQASAPGTVTMNTALAGNSNAGHWFTNDKARKGRIGPKLTDAQKYDIIAYLKTATYATYPTKTVTSARPLPCGNDRNWAKDLAY